MENSTPKNENKPQQRKTNEKPRETTNEQQNSTIPLSKNMNWEQFAQKKEKQKKNLKIKQKANRREYDEKHQRTDVISMKPGNRTLTIASINPDTFITPEQKNSITQMLQQKKYT